MFARVLRQPFQLEGMSLRVDASIGVSLAPEHGTMPETLLQKADVAMFAAKRSHLALAGLLIGI